MKLRNKLIATIVSISMILAVIGVGAWASTESFTATVTNTVNLEFDNLKGQVIVMAGGGADNLQVQPPVIEEQVLYDGTNVVYNQISQNPTDGTNLYWDGTMFLDSSDEGLGIVNNQTQAACLLYAFGYMPTEECLGTSSITAMVTEINVPEIDGGMMVARYFASTDPNFQYWWPIVDGDTITPIRDNEMLAIMAVCQFYTTDGGSITTMAGKWDFQVTFSAGRNEVVELGPDLPDGWTATGLELNVFDFFSGIVIPYERLSHVNPIHSDTVWDLVEFGEYPQTLKADNVTITSTTPDANGYYAGSDGARYAKAVAISDDITISGVELTKGTEYYFKVEPIKWRVLESEDGVDYVVADKILDRSVYQDAQTMLGWEEEYMYFDVEEEDWSQVTSPEDGTYEDWDTMDPDHPDFEVPIITTTIEVPMNDYDYSDLKVFVEQTFYNKAFSASEKAQMKSISPGVGWSGYNNPDYNLINVGWAPTDYAVALGVDWWSDEASETIFGKNMHLYYPGGYGECWLGSAENTQFKGCADVILASLYGDDGIENSVNSTLGVVPAIYIQR